MRNTVLVIEFSLSGHRGEYVKWIVHALLHKEHKVILMLPESLLLHESIASLDHSLLEVKSFDIGTASLKHRSITRLGLFGVDYLYYSNFKRIYKSIKCTHVDHVFVPFLDYMLYSISIFGSPFGECGFSGISMRPDFHYAKMKLRVPRGKGLWLKEFMFDRLLSVKKLTSLLTLDQALYIYYKTNKQGSNRLKFLPEPVTLLEQDKSIEVVIKNKLGINDSIRNILVYGSLTLRKGVKGLLDALSVFSDEEKFRVILAGKANSEVSELIEDPSYLKLIEDGKLIFLNRYISSEEESVLFSNAYICWLGYIGHYRASGVLIQSAKYGVPLIATTEGVIGWQVEKYSIGITVDSKMVDEISSAIYRLFNDVKLYQNCKASCKTSFIENTFENAYLIVNESIS